MDGEAEVEIGGAAFLEILEFPLADRLGGTPR